MCIGEVESNVIFQLKTKMESENQSSFTFGGWMLVFTKPLEAQYSPEMPVHAF
jgi:hypothetical protein